MQKKRVLVTGGAGFIGSHLVDYLVKKGNVVTSVDDLSGGYRENINKNGSFIKLDLRDLKKTKLAVLKARPDIIYHLAADATEGRSQFTPIECTGRNYQSTLNLLVSAINSKVKRFIFTSSMAVYGAQKAPFNEAMPTRPEDIYGISKASSEKAVEILSKVHGMEYVIIRPHNVYGPRQNMADPYRNVIAIFMNRILQGKAIYIYGDGEQKRAFSYVSDMIPAIAETGFIRSANGEIFNLGSDTPFTINNLVKTLSEVSGKKIAIEHIKSRPQEVKLAYCKHDKAKRILKFSDKTKLSQGLLEMWKWALDRGSQTPKYMDMEIISSQTPTTWKKHLI